MQSHRPVMGPARRVTGMVLVILPSVMLIGSSLAKFAEVPTVAGPLAKLGFSGDRLLFIATLELLSALLFLLPRTRALGLLLISSYLGGAIAAHMSHGETIVQPAFVLTLFWIATAVRNPEAFWSRTPEQTTSVAATTESRVAA